ncbi:hypothetical protein PUMCH_004594 [Australozyma saopauloensis]|uniref:Uncharacterized protein n=1 Tax=Australozyma saopauloensis TaxID=291208 RepID=A0AAX4HG41_9ASCO|nr:hypothetical protein PUMCH_004594 [[Candida] saopauloensis]
MRSMSPNVCPKITGDRDNGMDGRRQRPWCRMHGGSSAQCSVMAEKRSSFRITENPAGPELPKEPKEEKHEKNTHPYLLLPPSDVALISVHLKFLVLQVRQDRRGLPSPIPPTYCPMHINALQGNHAALAGIYGVHQPIRSQIVFFGPAGNTSTGCKKHSPCRTPSHRLISLLYLLIAARHRRLLTISDHIRHR